MKLFEKLKFREEIEEERKATWTELFFDLAFVVSIGIFSHRLAADLSFEGIIIFLLLFTPLWWAWVGHTFFSDRFDNDDLASRGLTVLQMIFTLYLAIAAKSALEDANGLIYFVIAYVAIRSTLVFSYVRVYFSIEKAKKLALRYILGFSFALVPWILAALIEPKELKYLLSGLGILIDLGTAASATNIQAKLPVSISHIPERFGLFTTLVLGEVLLMLLNSALLLEVQDVSSLLVIAFGIVIAFVVWFLYFASLDGRPLQKIKFASQIWVYNHLVLVIGLVVLAISFEEVVHSLEHSEHIADANEQTPFKLLFSAWIICLSTIAVFRLITRSIEVSKVNMAYQMMVKLVILVVSVFWLIFIPTTSVFINMLMVVFMGLVFIGIDLVNDSK